MVQLQASYQLHGTFTQKKDALSQRGEGARGLSGWLTGGPKKAALGSGRLARSGAVGVRRHLAQKVTPTWAIK